MKTLVCEKPYKLSFVDRQRPKPGSGEALIKIRRVGICGTDMHAFEGNQPFFSYPRVLGHELSGEVVEIGSGVDLKPGEAVAVMPYLNCGKCVACVVGKTNCCVSMRVLGVHMDGGMAEYLTVPATNLISGNGLTIDELAILEPLAIGAHGIRRAAVIAGEHVVVIGAGPIGIAAMWFAKIAGGQVIVIDVDSERLGFCSSVLGFQKTINAAKEDVAERVRQFTSGAMAQTTMDCSGNLNAINAGFQYMAHAGRYVLVGLQNGNMSVNHPEFHKREGTLMSSRNATVDDFNLVIESIKCGLIKPNDYISHRMRFSTLATQFDGLVNHTGLLVKALVDMDV